MNDKAMLERALTPILTSALDSFPVVVLTGARQTGKTTLVRQLGASTRDYLSLDDIDVMERARLEPEALVRTSRPLTLDEVQRSPELLLAVKRAVDARRRPGRFLLTGSANLLLMRRVAETLAGRAAYLKLWPLTRRERLGLAETGIWSELFGARDDDWLELVESQAAPMHDWKTACRLGGYPTPSHELEDWKARSLWLAGYTSTYLERDLRELSAVGSLVDFRRLMRAACLRLANLVNQTELARDVSLSQPTVHRHLALLETSYQAVRVPAYAVNRTKRLIKSPKLFWSDTALALHLSGEDAPRGAHLENLILCDLLAWRETLSEPAEILYWRTTQGQEIDLVIEWQGRLLPIEVKATARPRLADIRALRIFREEYKDLARAALLLHTGSRTSWMADGILAAPWWRVI